MLSSYLYFQQQIIPHIFALPRTFGARSIEASWVLLSSRSVFPKLCVVKDLQVCRGLTFIQVFS